ncbi:MAG: Fe-S-containing hydro-lyase [Chloroflexota bacterium]|nr:Fe-S-containing hydro-lyase [Chloroflexota bacterium]
MSNYISVTSPIKSETVESLRAGDHVIISGIVYTARDTAHQRMVDALRNGELPPFDVAGQTLYYSGPSPARPGHPVGSSGPTTSSRMDIFTPKLLDAGLRAMIGKGERSAEVKRSMIRHKAVYFAATGGTGALIAKCIKTAEIVAYEDLGAEAILRLEVENLPTIVANDIYAGDLYEAGRARYQTLDNQVVNHNSHHYW